MYKQNGEPAIESITDLAEGRTHVSPSLANALSRTPTYCHQGTPTENEKVLKLQNDLALVQDVLRWKPRERHDRFNERY